MKPTKRRRRPVPKPNANRPSCEVSAFHISGLGDTLPVTWALEKSYVLSMLWAWYSQVRLRPQVRIPIPRMFSYRDP